MNYQIQVKSSRVLFCTIFKWVSLPRPNRIILTVFPVLLFIFISGFLTGQTLIDVKGGINWLTFRNSSQTEGYSGSFASPPSYSMGIDIKGLKPRTKHLHLGLSLEYYLNNINWNAEYGGVQTSLGQNICYHLGTLRFSVYPELFFGNKLKFFFNLGPYLSLIVNSSKTGISWDYSYPGQYTDNIESGSAKNDFKPADVGIRESLGIGYSLIPCLVLSVEENGGIGFLNIDNTIGSAGFIKTSNLGVFVSLTYIIHRKKPKE